MDADVTLVNPPYPKQAHQHPSLIPLGLAYLGAVLEKNHFSVKVIDCQTERFTHGDLEYEISKHDPGIVGVTSTTLTYKSALKVAETAKRVHPQCLTILGGCHATFWDVNALDECQQLDMVARREGEYTLLKIAERLKEKKSINRVEGITFRDKGKIIKNSDRPYIEDLDSLPFPAHHLFLMRQLKTAGQPIFPLITSRGCVYSCNFCSAVKMFGQRYRMRSPKNVVDEMQFLHEKYGADRVTFYDDAFTVDQPRTEKICEEILNRGLKSEWDCETRVDMVTEELINKMKGAGCTAIFFGVESGSSSIIDSMGKKISLNQTRKAFKWANAAGIVTIASVLLGFPGETKETAMQTIRFVEELNPSDVGYHVATPYPGTPMYDYVKNNGWLRTTDFERYDTATPIFDSPNLSTKELAAIREKAYQRFYLRPTYFLSSLMKGGMYGMSSARTSIAWFLRSLGIKLS